MMLQTNLISLHSLLQQSSSRSVYIKPVETVWGLGHAIFDGDGKGAVIFSSLEEATFIAQQASCEIKTLH